VRFPIHFFKNGAICAEIGVFKGVFAEQILKKQPSELHLVDPWLSYPGKQDRCYSALQVEMDLIYDSVVEKFKKNKNVKIHRRSSKQAAAAFCDDFFDWIYIDADHSYHAVKEDLELWFQKVKPGGFLCGDDFAHNEKLQWGVIPAVTEFVAKNNLELKLHLPQAQFVIKKGDSILVT